MAPFCLPNHHITSHSTYRQTILREATEAHSPSHRPSPSRTWQIESLDSPASALPEPFRGTRTDANSPISFPCTRLLHSKEHASRREAVSTPAVVGSRGIRQKGTCAMVMCGLYRTNLIDCGPATSSSPSATGNYGGRNGRSSREGWTAWHVCETVS